MHQGNMLRAKIYLVPWFIVSSLLSPTGLWYNIIPLRDYYLLHSSSFVCIVVIHMLDRTFWHF